ncbi:hypothetical protein Trydic_g3311 [Trypoxylus dichotomus]
MGCNPYKCTCGPKYFLPQRYIVAIMSLTGILVGYGHRVSLHIAITVMANKTLSRSTSCPSRNTSLLSSPKNLSGGVIEWTNHEQNLVLGAFYPGYLIGHIPTGILADKYGARYVFSIGMGVSTALCLITPIVVVNTPYWVTIILRNVMGLGQSVIYTAISALYAKWVPKEERSMIGAFSFAANSLGVIFGNFFTGMVINVFSSWPIGFYFWGVQGVVWCTVFILYIYSEPATSRNITNKEKTLLDEKIHHGKRPKIPWVGFAKDIGLWALVISEVGHDLTVFTLVNNFPKYLSDVLHYELAENALASSLPYLCQWVGGIITGPLVDYTIKKEMISILASRRIVTSIGSVLPATFVLIGGYMGCNGPLVITMFALNLFFKGTIYAAMKINHLDMSIHFAGILMALSNGIGALSGYISPEIINLLAPNNTLEEWQNVFWVVWAAAFISNLFYIFFSVADRRKWDYPKEELDEYYKLQEEKKAEKEKQKQEKLAKKEAKKKKDVAGPST